MSEMTAEQVAVATEAAEADTWPMTRGLVGLRYAPRPAKQVMYVDTSNLRALSDSKTRNDVLEVDTVIGDGSVSLVDAHPDAGRLLVRFGAEVTAATVGAVSEVLRGLWSEAYGLGYDEGWEEGWDIGWRKCREWKGDITIG